MLLYWLAPSELSAQIVAFNHFAVGWAHATDTPYQWTKQVASHWGGTRNGLIVHWPRGPQARGELRSQFHHVIDVAPTILGVPASPSRRSSTASSSSRCMAPACATALTTARRLSAGRPNTSSVCATGASTTGGGLW